MDGVMQVSTEKLSGSASERIKQWGTIEYVPHACGDMILKSFWCDILMCSEGPLGW